MTFPLLERRMLLRGGVAVAGGLAFAGLSLDPAAASLPAGAAAVKGALVGWLVVAPDGGGQIRLVELDALSRPARYLATETIAPATSLAGASRQAGVAAVRCAAGVWNVPVEECVCGWGRIEHRLSGRSVPFSIWTDFT